MKLALALFYLYSQQVSFEEVDDLESAIRDSGHEVLPVVENQQVFDLGDEERRLLDLVPLIGKRIPAANWKQLVNDANVYEYIVRSGDWLWKISERIFGSGFYYSKIWALNPFITNPHEIEPGMILTFNTGDDVTLPQVVVGDPQYEGNGTSVSSGSGLGSPNSSTSGYASSSGDSSLPTPVADGFDGSGDEELENTYTQTIVPLADSERAPEIPRENIQNINVGDGTNRLADNIDIPWLSERKRLMDQGVNIQSATNQTIESLQQITEIQSNQEYKNYEPNEKEIVLSTLYKQYDESGIDRNMRIDYKFSEGFYLNTFLSTNSLLDLGEIESAPNYSGFIYRTDTVYIRFHGAANVLPGDKYSVYLTGDMVSHALSERSGREYTIIGSIEIIKKVDDLWEAIVLENNQVIKRGDRITAFNPRIDKIITTNNPRQIDAAIIGAFDNAREGIGLGNVVYLDRGRADGLEMGNVFDVVSFYDRGTKKKITEGPTYSIGEVVVISLTDNFATGLITNSTHNIPIGSICVTKEGSIDAYNFETVTEDGVDVSCDGVDCASVSSEEVISDINSEAVIEEEMISEMDYNPLPPPPPQNFIEQRVYNDPSVLVFGDEINIPWLAERKGLMDDGVVVNYSSVRTYEDLEALNKDLGNREYEHYVPRETVLNVQVAADTYDKTGFDTSSVVRFDVKEGNDTNSFISSNTLMDFGFVDAAQTDTGFLYQTDIVYVRFNESVSVSPGDKYSVYTDEGIISSFNSDRSGHKYTIVGHIEILKQVEDLWECRVTGAIQQVERNYRITSYTPKMDRILKNHNPRRVEAVIIGGYNKLITKYSSGDIVYLDRGRSDGLETGNVLDTYSNLDRNREKAITQDLTTYRTGDMMVVFVSDNFATAMITASTYPIDMGSLAITRSADVENYEKMIRDTYLNKDFSPEEEDKTIDNADADMLYDVDVELNVDDLNAELGEEAATIKLTDDEIRELNRREREKSVIDGFDPDVEQIEALEEELLKLEQDANKLQEEEETTSEQPEAEEEDIFDAIDTIEEQVGRKYMQEDLNSKENFYGLTEYDIEEMDELFEATEPSE